MKVEVSSHESLPEQRPEKQEYHPDAYMHKLSIQYLECI